VTEYRIVKGELSKPNQYEVLAWFRAKVAWRTALYDCVQGELFVPGAVQSWVVSVHWSPSFASAFSRLTCVEPFKEDCALFQHVQLVIVMRRMKQQPAHGFPVVTLDLEADEFAPFINDFTREAVRMVAAYSKDSTPTSAIMLAARDTMQKWGQKHAVLDLLNYIKVTGSEDLGDMLTETDLEDIERGWDEYAKKHNLTTVEESVKDFEECMSVETWDEYITIIGGEEYLEKPVRQDRTSSASNDATWRRKHGSSTLPTCMRGRKKRTMTRIALRKAMQETMATMRRRMTMLEKLQMRIDLAGSPRLAPMSFAGLP
jgi:hypothetical protein